MLVKQTVKTINANVNPFSEMATVFFGMLAAVATLGLGFVGRKSNESEAAFA